ncbi:MAG: deoxyribose-phosphate aldolase [Gammaproteobacteria bacterium]|nr:deoxyribose-phosphate aldolase [Gammaproteobacteria bacterium]
MQKVAVARRILQLLDLTSLNDDDTAQTVITLCDKADTPFGPVAAVCVWPQFVKTAAERLAGSSLRIASVANFPDGHPDPEPAKKQTMQIIRDGGDEVDVVFPWRNCLDGDFDSGSHLVSGCKSRCGNAVKLKVILETGELLDDAIIYRASRVAIDAGADFIKTSTGKSRVSATLPAARTMLRAIGDAGGGCGLKVSGGIKTLDDARDYLELAEVMMGADWISPESFRFGASGLLDALLRELEKSNADL